MIGKITPLTGLGVTAPVLAAPMAGGPTTPQVAAVVHSGADAVMTGTPLLRAAESGASAVHQATIADHVRGETVLTRCFTGRPARALRNGFIDRHGAHDPSGYPAIHHLTSPIRKAAAAAGDPETVHLWAGTGYQHATPGRAAGILRSLAGAL